MSYESQAALAQDPAFQSRVRASLVEQSNVFLNDARPSFVSLAEALLRGDHPLITPSFLSMVAAAPGLADEVDTPDGIDSSKVTDAQILSAVQALYPTQANLWFDDTGKPI
jgi:hypothetical protein